MLPIEFKNELISIETQTFLNGYIRLLNENQSKEIEDICKNAAGFEGTPFATTAFADVFVWDGKYIMLYKFKDNRVEVVSSGYKYFCTDMRDRNSLEDFYEIELFEETKKIRGNIRSDECYTFEPMLSLGGDKSANSTGVGKIREHLSLIISAL